jgi:hypothetical protein
MKMKDVISEVNDFLNENFDMSSAEIKHYSYSTEIDVVGSLTIKENVELKELPFQFGHVQKDFKLTNCGLTSLKNFPKSAGNIVDVSDNPDLVSLGMNNETRYVHFIAKNCGMKDLNGCKLIGPTYIVDLSDCKNLESLNGIDQNALEIINLYLYNCDKFKQDISTYRINTANVDLEKNSKPFLFSVLKGSPNLHLYDLENGKFKDIVYKYFEKGITEIFDLIRELRDNQFI